MRFVPYILDGNGKGIAVDIVPMSDEDARKTNALPKWQTSWTSDYIS